MRTIARCFLLFGLVAVVPRVAAAQATLAGEVKDTTGAVLPGVTVEAASPALIEKVRTAVTDGSGRYRIESLPPGSYTVTFSLTGFAPVKREDLIVSGSGVITVDVELTVGGLAETITVTPRRRDESSLDVPGAINAFTAADIKTAGIDRPQDFVALTPNMSLVQTQNQGTSFVTVRGISQARNSEPSVAVLIDGVQMANPSQFNQELFDIDTIQVLKGPQGALYGRNAIGGAIIINTKKPSDVFQGNVTLGGDSGPGINVRGSMSGPISDTLKYIASASLFRYQGLYQECLSERGRRSVSRRVRAPAIGVGAVERAERGCACVCLGRSNSGALLQYHGERERHEPAGAREQRWCERTQYVRHVAQARLREASGHADVHHRLRPVQRDLDRRSIQFPADSGIGAVQFLRRRSGAASVSRRQCGERGAAIRIACDEARALDRGCVSDLDRSFHFHGQCLRPGHRRGARGAAGSLAALQSAVHLPCRLAGQFRLGGVRQHRRQSHGQTGVVDVVALRP